MTRIPSRAEIDLEYIARGGLYQFVKRAWPAVEATPYIDNWHIAEKCRILEAVTRGECKRLVINEPPGCTKSLVVSVMWPVWEWIQDPTVKWIFASYDDSLARRDASKAIGLISSDWFRERWSLRIRSGPASSKPREKVATNDYWTIGGGWRWSTSCPYGRVTGRHANRHVVDDPIKPMQTAGSIHVSHSALAAVEAWWANTMATRVADPKTLGRVVMMQRLADSDLAGVCLAQGYEHLCFPMRYDPSLHCANKWATDRRTVDGELLWPARFSESDVRALEIDLGPANAEAQLQQRPTVKGGTIFKAHTFKHWKELPLGFGQFVQSWDLTFKAEGTSRVCGDLWLISGASFYLVDWIVRSMSFSETVDEIERRSTVDPLWKRAGAKLIENKANGPAVLSVLESRVPGMIPVNPHGSKEERANAVTPYYAAGNVYHPDRSVKPEIEERELILTGFPRGRFDDEVDTTSQFLNWARGSRPSLLDAMSRALARKPVSA